MTALSTAKIEDAVVTLEPDAADQKIDFSGGIAIVLDHIAVGLKVKRIEQGAPPIRGQMTLEVRYRTQRPRTGAPVLLCMFQQGAIYPGVNGQGPRHGSRIVGFLTHVYLGCSNLEKAGSVKETADKVRFSNLRERHPSRPTVR